MPTFPLEVSTVTDLVAALATCATYGGGDIRLLPSATPYIIPSSSPLSIPRSTRLRSDWPGAAILEQSGSAVYAPVVLVDNAAYVTLENLEVHANGVNSQCGIELYHAFAATLRNVAVRSLTAQSGTGILIHNNNVHGDGSASYDLLFERVAVEGCYYGWSIGDPADHVGVNRITLIAPRVSSNAIGFMLNNSVCAEVVAAFIANQTDRGIKCGTDTGCQTFNWNWRGPYFEANANGNAVIRKAAGWIFDGASVANGGFDIDSDSAATLLWYGFYNGNGGVPVAKAGTVAVMQ